MTKNQLIEVLKSKAEIDIVVHPEDTPIEGNVLASGDEDEDRRAEQYVLDQLKNGNELAWCTIEVKASFEGINCSDYLGCCSYSSFKEFENGGYYSDMVDQAIDGLADEILTLKEKLNKIA